VNRRGALCALLALAAAQRASYAQQQGKVWRVGNLDAGSQPSASGPSGVWNAFVLQMQDLGYFEGKNLAIESRYSDGHDERLPALAAELVRAKPDVIVTHNLLTTRAAQRATSTIPIVFAAMTDPIVAGVVKSLARPEANVTGLSMMSVEISSKHVELLAETIKNLTRIAFLMAPARTSISSHVSMLQSAQAAAKRIGATVLPLEAGGADEIERAFVEAAGWHAEAMIVAANPYFSREQRRIIQLALKQRLPTIFAFGYDAAAGGLMSYGQDLRSFYRRAAILVDKIFKGAKPGDLPIEQPTTFEFAVNLKTAKKLGIAIPPSVLLRADRVFE